MTRDEKIINITNAIQINENLMILLKDLIVSNINNVDDARLDAIIQLLELNNG